jgi:adenine/guanine phosphoribosyltransferase-like PRPP-binding protein
LCLSQNLLFKDLSLLLANPKAYGGVIDALVAKYAKRDVTAVVGIGAAFIGV